MASCRRPHRIIYSLGLLICSTLLIGLLPSCEETCYDGEKNNNEEAIDCGGPCVPCDTTGGTCFDGIQNQGETGIDCGGPCNACITDTTVLNSQFLCNGTGSNAYFPLAHGSYWIYAMPSSQWFQLEVVGDSTLGGNVYAHVITTGAFGTIHDFFRETTGQVLRWNDNLGAAEIYIPANPSVGQQWATTSSDSVVIDDVLATLNSQNGCVYDSLLQITSFSGGSGSTSYYMRGLGLVELSSASAYLDSAVVY